MQWQLNSEKSNDKSNQVIIRIWFPKVNNKPTGIFKAASTSATKEKKDANVGHVSIETKNNYVSMWPSEAIGNMFKLFPSAYHTLGQDEQAESGPADLYLRLYSLNSEKIDDAFKKVQETGVGYVFVGDSSLASDEGQSCCSLAYFLLQAGGIDKLDARQGSTMKSSVVTPGNFADFIKRVKKKEVELHPETEDYSRESNEYFPDPPKAKKVTGCVIT